MTIMYNTSARVKKPVTLQLTHPGISDFVPFSERWIRKMIGVEEKQKRRFYKWQSYL